ncbi:AAA family ATPase [Arthrobacter sp. ok362]|uniref:AAA family ATPase n=1 Tax=Arthrobacter sp. ok362 TaxID=1761745 RepID=UPI00088964A4|nr:AAA family ATPase [Arthrobacter sp. ok362]SDK80501.1 AAA domain-containing protein [Arthrobacter sp. ok362]
MTKIIRLATTNYKVLKAAEIIPDPDGNLVIVAGKNGQGKTSLLDSITAALGGVNAKTTPKPIRDGEDKAEIVLETEELIVTRKFTASGSTLTVKSIDGAVYPKGQAKLDDLLGKLSLDPLAFTQLSDRDQLATLLDLVDLPFDHDKLVAERKEIFERRTDANRKVKELTARAADYVSQPADLPDEEVSVSALVTAYREGQTLNHNIDVALTARNGWAEKVERVKRELAEAERELELATKRADAAPAKVDLDGIQAQIDGAETINEAVRHHKAGERVRADLTIAQQDASALTDAIEEIDMQKAAGLEAATFPIEGLGFDETGVTYQGVPFKQASGAEQLRVSLAMAIALNPKMRVIRIADGSLLDTDNLALVEAVAKEHDFQVWIEMVGDGDGRGIVIEDGSVVGG